jgi:hypothetical protein
MDTYTIDIELEHYYGDRMAMSSKEACRRFYLRAVARFNGQELERYLEGVRSHAAVYTKINHMLRSPVTHVETPLFLTGLVLWVASIVMVMSGELSALVAFGASAGLVGMLQCLRKLADYWQTYAVREAVFREFSEVLLRETTTP